MARKLPQRSHAFKVVERVSGVRPLLLVLTVALVSVLGGCSRQAWNYPYRAGEAEAAVFYSSFSERPKHFDPARSYSSNEGAFISQVYEPPLQYHFLRRPYELVPQTAQSLPEIRHYASDGSLLDADAPASEVAYTDYVLRIRPGIRYQPHPALARGDDGSFTYWPLDAATLGSVAALADFERTGSRELVAADYLYQIKRLAFDLGHPDG